MDLFASYGIPAAVSAVISGGATYFAKGFFDHALKRDVERYKSELKGELDRRKAELDGTIKQQVEASLAKQASNLEYELEARKRLYLAIGPLRFQLLLACRELATRIKTYGTGTQYPLTVSNYYGKSMLYRTIRPLALTELAERQVTIADFAIEPSAVELLLFKKRAAYILSDSDLVDGLPGLDWNSEAEHVYMHSIGVAANALIKTDANMPSRCMRFDELVESLKTKPGVTAISPFPAIFDDFKIVNKPIFWLRLVAYGYLCNQYVNGNGLTVGFEAQDFPLETLLLQAKDPTLTQNLATYAGRCKTYAAMKL